MIEVNIGLAFLAGLASFLAPCVLPLVPAYLGYLSGYAVTQSERPTRQERLLVVAHAVAFVIGFSLVFVALGVAASWIGGFLRGDWLRYLGGLLIIFFGLALLELLHVPFLQKDMKLQWRGNPRWGLLSSLLVGMVFAAGWTPCVGPALSSILILSADQSTAGQGAGLLLAYSAGIGVPFIVAGYLIDRLSGLLAKAGKYTPWVQKFAGVVLILVGILLITNRFGALGLWLEQRGIGWDLNL